MKPEIRIGHGYDVHKTGSERDLIIGGVNIPCDFGLIAHSDGDVLVHAVIDALFGAAALPDIGSHFPDTDESYSDADSMKLLEECVAELKGNGYSIINIDTTVIAQRPKLKDYIPHMKKKIADACGIEIGAVNVKATTEERLGFTGSGEGIAAHAVCLICRE